MSEKYAAAVIRFHFYLTFAEYGTFSSIPSLIVFLFSTAHSFFLAMEMGI